MDTDINKSLTRNDKSCISLLYLTIVFGAIMASFSFGSGIYSVIQVRKNQNTINDEINFLLKRIHDNQGCISVDTQLNNIFANCPVISTINPFFNATVTDFQSSASCRPDIISQNNENIKLNFQNGIHLPGMSFTSINNPNTNQFLPVQGCQSFEMNQIDISNDLTIKYPSGSMIFGDTGTISAQFPIFDDGGYNFISPFNYRNYNNFYIGSFSDQSSTSTTRCNTGLGLLSSSIYVLLSSNVLNTKFCSCVPTSSTTVQEFCSSSLQYVGGISNSD